MTTVVFIIQFFFMVITGIYFLKLLKSQNVSKVSIDKNSKSELERLKKLKSVKLSPPLSEQTRPTETDEIIGQNNAITALRAVICCPNPQHVLIYGPSGVGKTAAARVILEEAKNNPVSPFDAASPFVEIDATTLRFDERGIADPLIGSVHDPIYQGAGAFGSAGIPQPKAGAVTNAHGGILFIDEIGELSTIQMNKLLKVLEDRKVMFESSYYNKHAKYIPQYIHDIFKNGLPADFRLIGATTRSPEEIPPAVRSRCVEIFFNPLKEECIKLIAGNTCKKIGFSVNKDTVDTISKYSDNGRDTVNIIQIAAGLAMQAERKEIIKRDIEWVAEFSRMYPKVKTGITNGMFMGKATGLAVYGHGQGTLLEVEATAEQGKGGLKITGAVESEQISSKGHSYNRKSLISASAENVLTMLRNVAGIDFSKYNVHINFPGGTFVDGPSAGSAIAVAVYSAVTGTLIPSEIAFTGEVSIHGDILPVGGVPAKLEAAFDRGVRKVIIPDRNRQDLFIKYGSDVIYVDNFSQILSEIDSLSDKAKRNGA